MESGTPATADKITDFVSGTDSIDLSAIDANLHTGGDESFTFLATENTAFTAAGQLRFRYEVIDSVDYTIIEGNVNNELTADVRIELVGTLTFNPGTDFVL